ncbi:efflux RND transporter permease subunit [Geosporobacter ferrireducens]|uniref:Multidrug transporter n=1 Tax=Geosporobacter ferrireducens TaxID=1424294 RepID=A0A1D8GER8_9FIRM|nr:efflux RND transporter permease subunit [Geosporobacter ferrireducens]AOT69383.1 multidrug transporter [Geosporobacter ferrireducens]
MKKGFVEMIIEKHLFVTIVMVMLMISGIYSYVTIPKQNFPEVVLPVAAVNVVYPGASAEDMEELVTKKIENEVMKLDGFDSCNSQTLDNISIVMVSLDMNLSQERVDKSFEELRRKIDDLKPSLPKGVAQVVVQTDIMDTAGALFTVTGEGVSGDELAQRTEELKDKLKLLDGVKKIDITGKLESEVKITVNSVKLNHIGISLTELANIISAQNSIIPTGTIDIENSKITVNSSGKFKNIEEIKNIVVDVSQDTGAILKLSDIAEVNIKTPDDIPKYLFNKKESTVLALYLDKGLNVVGLGDSIRTTVEEFKTTLPDNIQVNEVYFQPDVVNDAIKDFINNLIASIVLVIIVIMLGLNFRNGIVVSIVIPIVILTNFIIMKLLGIDIQFVSLAALIVVLGMLVDNSVVVSDAIQTRLDNGEDRLKAVVNGTQDVAVPVFVSMLTTVAGFLSLLTLTGAYRQLAFSLPTVIITCLVISFVVSMVITPFMSYSFLRKSDKSEGKVSKKLADLYDKIFQRAFRCKGKALTIALLFMIVCISSLLVIDFQIIGKANKDVITIEVMGNNEVDIRKTEAVIHQIQNILDEQPETRYYLSGIGIGVPRYDYSVLPRSQFNNVGDVFVKIDLKKSKRFKNTSEIVEYLQGEFDSRVTGGKAIVDELGIFAFTSKPVEMKIYSDDLNDLNDASDKIVELMKNIKGTKNIDNGREVATYNYYIDMNTNILSSLGLSKAEAQNELSIALMGRDVSIYRQQGKEYNIVLESDIDSENRLKNFKVKASATGAKYNVQQFSDVALKPQISSISRLDGQRGRAVGAFVVTGYSNIAIQTELEKQIIKLDFPDNIRMEKSGEKKDFMEVLISIGKAAAFSVILILMILIFQFNSLKTPLIVLISVPFGAAAGIAGLYLTGQNITFFALMGVLSLFGCALANAIVLVEFINSERLKGVPTEEACKVAGAKRFRPILMSTMTTVLGLLPLAAGGDTLFIPMAILLIVGLSVSMIINLILVPIVYDMTDNWERKNINKWMKKENKIIKFLKNRVKGKREIES